MESIFVEATEGKISFTKKQAEGDQFLTIKNKPVVQEIAVWQKAFHGRVNLL
jgi:hypothetical protein